MASEYEEDEDGQMRFPFFFNPSAPRGRASTVTESVKRRIRELRDAGHIQSDIAGMLGLNQGRVSEVLRGLR